GEDPDRARDERAAAAVPCRRGPRTPLDVRPAHGICELGPVAGGATSARLIEVELRVRDLERALYFYRDVIGLPFGDVETHAGDNIRHAHVTWGEWGECGEFLMINLYPA